MKIDMMDFSCYFNNCVNLDCCNLIITLPHFSNKDVLQELSKMIFNKIILILKLAEGF